MRVEVERMPVTSRRATVTFRMGGREYRVEELWTNGTGPDDTWFKVRAEDGGSYILRLNAADRLDARIVQGGGF
jgi:hypothetical protein